METKKEKIVSAVATIGIILTLFGATYAYFASRTDAGKIMDVEVTANTVDVLTFGGGWLNLADLDQESFAEGERDGFLIGSAKATLTPNNKTKNATRNYNVYLNISNNTFSYSLGSDKPEILLSVTDADGAEVTSLDGLTYSTVTDGQGNQISGFDITTKTGLFTLVNNKEITANIDTKEEKWSIWVWFVNYNEDQSANAGRNFKARLMIQEKPNLAAWVMAQYADQVEGSETIYFHDGNSEYGAFDNSYRYAGPSDAVNNFVCFGSDAETCPDDNLYRIIGVFGDQVKLIKWDYATTDLLGTDGDYSNTYSESGRDETSKGTNVQTAIGTYYWNNANYSAAYSATNKYNVWSYSELNTVNLNENFINNIGQTWANKIATTTWIVGGVEGYTLKDPVLFVFEGEYYNTQYIYTNKIGLMYASDYGYAASPSAWGDDLGDYSSYINDNWMYMGLWEWTITPISDSKLVLCVVGDGYIANRPINNSNFVLGVRPTFYLEPTINYVSGDGTKNSPIVIE